jgi:sulfopyruvate decarboxylase TPP-binding subunit
MNSVNCVNCLHSLSITLTALYEALVSAKGAYGGVIDAQPFVFGPNRPNRLRTR